VPKHNIVQGVDGSLQPNSCSEIVSALITSTQEIPGCTIHLITCKVKGKTSCFEESMEGLVEPTLIVQHLPNYLCIAQSLSTITPDKKLILHIVNVSPSPIKVSKGMKLGDVIPIQNE